MRVSVVNFCSTALDMLDFSSKMLIENAGTDDFDYIVVTWNPTPEVEKWIADYKQHKNRIQIWRGCYFTNDKLTYIPNLRAMMSFGFDAGYLRNDWVVIVNTDMAFGRNWLVNLVRRAGKDVIPNSLHLTPIVGPNVITVDLGVPTVKTFDISRFWKLHDELYREKVETEEERGGWRNTNTFPYVIHRKWWDACGPWRPNHIKGQDSPDRQFFERCHKAGAKFVLVHDSIVYHHEAVERRQKKRPVGIENMPEGQ